jgi:2-dehydro-3-deoxyglucarate aldolase
VLIEAQEGVRNIEAIMGIEGIDGAIVGSGDLSTNLGAPGDYTTPAYVSAVESVERAVRTRRKILGAKPYGSYSLPVLLERGHRLIMIGRDMALVRSAFADALNAAKREGAKPGA